MKSKLSYIGVVALLVTGLAFTAFNTKTVETEGIAFEHTDFKSAQALAKKQGKLIFIDGYATWCGPCKLMARTVFKEKKVGDYYNENFVNLKIDMETPEGRMLASKYAVRAYPTYLYLDANGKVVHRAMGATNGDKFIGFGKQAVSKK